MAPLGQMIFAPACGWWTNRRGSVRLAMLTATVIFIGGNSLYASLTLLPRGTSGLTRSIGMLVAR